MQMTLSEVPEVPLTPLLPASPLHSCSEHRGSVKSILGGAIELREATVKLEWLGPGWDRESLLPFFAQGGCESAVQRAEQLKNSLTEI